MSTQWMLYKNELLVLQRQNVNKSIHKYAPGEYDGRIFLQLPMKRLAIALTSISLLTPLTLLAQDIRVMGDSTELRLGNDLYTAGDTVDISGNSAGDTIAVGNEIMIRGNMQGDVQAAGNTVSISGTVQDDVRIIGNAIHITGNIAGDVVAFGRTIVVARGATIEGSLLTGGESVLIEGTVRGGVRLAGQTVSLLGPIGGDAYIDGKHVSVDGSIGGNATIEAEDLELGQRGMITGNLRYWNGQGQISTTGKVAGTTNFDASLQGEDSHAPEGGAAIVGVIFAAVTVYSLFYAALMIGLLLFFTKTIFVESAKRLKANPWRSLFIGFLYFFATPGLIVLLMFTLIGIPLAVALLMLYLIGMFFSPILASVILARLAETRYRKKWRMLNLFFATLGIYVLIKFLWLIPFLGWIAVLLAIFATYGALAAVKFERIKKIL